MDRIRNGNPGYSEAVLRVRRWSSARKLPILIAAFYCAAAILWVLVEHHLLGGSSTAKDVFFVFATGWFLFWFVVYGLRRIREKEAALQKSESYLAGILEANPCGVILVDRSGILRYANEAAARTFGVSRDELVGGPYDDAAWEMTTIEGSPVPPDRLPGVRVLRMGNPITDLECSVRRPDGRRVLLSMNCAPLRGTDGTVAGMVSSFFDISDRKRGELLTLRKLSIATEQNPAALMITDSECRIEYVNPAYSRLTGYPAGEVLGTRVGSVCAWSPETSREIDARVAAREGWKGICRGIRKSGDPFWEFVSVSPIRDPAGGVTHYLWIREDITEIREAEEALRESEERFRRIFEQNEEPVIMFRGGTAEILDANPAAVFLYGYSLREMKAEGPALFVDPEGREAFEEAIRGIEDGRPLVLDREVHRKRNGTKILVSVRGKRILLRDQPVSYCTFRDITARIRAEEEAKSRQAQLIHASRMASLGTIVAGVAHEINNPNNLIMVNAPMLAETWRDAEPILVRAMEREGEFRLGGLPFSEMRSAVPRLLEGILEGARRIRTIVTNLKEFSRQDEGRPDSPVGVNDVLRKAIQILNHEIQKRTRRFRVEYGDPPPAVSGNPQQLEQVFLNLLMNALEALPDASRGIRVTVSCRPEEHRVDIDVEDEGVGMPAEVLGRIAEPFFTTRQETGGLGLGLSLSCAIVRDHGGTIGFASEPGRGTRVRVSLPAVASGRTPVTEDPVRDYS